jgi:transcriptional pleiotropic repressor
MLNTKDILNNMSWTEQKALKAIFNDWEEEQENILVVSKVTDGIGVSRSVAINAFKKLEFCEMISTRSLGIKGSYIKVLDPGFLQAVKALDI